MSCIRDLESMDIGITKHMHSVIPTVNDIATSSNIILTSQSIKHQGLGKRGDFSVVVYQVLPRWKMLLFYQLLVCIAQSPPYLQIHSKY